MVTCGCVESGLEKNLAANAALQREDFRELLDDIGKTRETRISWDDAYRRMMEHNPSLRQSFNQLEQSRRLKRDQWLSLAPNLAAFVNLGDSISALTNINGDSLDARIVANLNIPNPFEFHARLYAAALQRQNAEWSHELDKRRAFVELHSAFTDQQLLAERQREAEGRLESLAPGQAADLPREIATIKKESLSIRRMRSIQQLRINQLLNTPGENWNLTGEPPPIGYSQRIGDLRIGENFGKLALNLQAIQIEGAILQRQRVKFQQWPAVTFGLSAPPLYSSEERAPDFSGDNLYFFSGASRSFNFSDPVGRQSLRDATERLEFTRSQLRLRIESEANRLLEARNSYLELLEAERKLRQMLKRIESSTSTEAILLLADLEERAQVMESLTDTTRRIRQLDLQLLLWDETYWK
ncbi:MAG: TolC family protein [Luteolibacter sp.]